ncbi:MAG: polymorphic toxin-type HINT domain-containing protein [Ardenticatenaceae bacterium]|nr:polymorphic toxin-type HINT domain-containing protein [Ardenticatenaceae bacterium]
MRHLPSVRFFCYLILLAFLLASIFPVTAEKNQSGISRAIMQASAPSPSPWALSYTPPGSSEFTGAAQFSYPIEVVPGVGGLTPDLTLFYSSGGLDNIRSPLVMSQGFGEGWSLPQAQIVNGNASRMYNAADYGGCCHNFDTARFSLELNGVSHRLKPITSGRHGRYSATGDPSLYIEFINGSSNPSLSNVTGEYWLVRTADGTEYRFGFNEDAEQVVAPVSALHNSSQPRNDQYAAYSWKLDTVKNTNDVRVLYSYVTSCGRDFVNPSTCRAVGNGVDDTEIDVALSQIKYNFHHIFGYLTTIDFSYYSRNGDGAEQSSYMVVGRYQPAAIEMAHAGQTLSRYEFNYELHSHVWDGSAFLNTSFWMLSDITKFGSDGSTPLPATTFTYDQEAPKSCDNDINNNDHCIGLLTKVENGYGAVTKLVYQEFGDRFYRVSDVYSWDGVEHIYDGVNSSAASHIKYDRTNATTCYDKDGYGCRSPFTVFGSGALVGFDQVSIQVYDPANPTKKLSEVQKTFNTSDYWLNGKTLTSTTIDPITQKPINQQTSEWNWENTADSVFARLEKVTSLNYDTGGQASGVEVTYAYDTYSQGNRQWGHVTGQSFKNITVDLDGNAGALISHSTRIRYVTNENEWIIAPFVNRTLDNNDIAIARTFYLYDGSLDPDDQLLTEGNLTLVREQKNWSDIDPGSLTVYETVDTAYTYDLFGNTETVTTYTGYGQQGFIPGANDWSFWTAPGNGSTARISTTSYDSIGLNVVRMENPLGHETSILYESEFPWLPTSVTDVENNITTKYEYDPFGRLHAVYDQSDFSGYGDSDPWNGNPLTRYRYWDNTWNDSWISVNWTNPSFVITTETRPYEFGPGPHNQLDLQSTLYDGFGRVVGVRNHNREIDAGVFSDVFTATGYDARGNAVCTSAPFALAVPGSIADSYPCADQDAKTITGYDSIGRPAAVTAPDGSRSATLYGHNSVYSHNPELQIQASFTDDLGRLSAVDEALAVYADDFSDGNLDGWTIYGPGTAVVVNGQLQIESGGNWRTVQKPIATAGSTDSGVSFSFQINDTDNDGDVQAQIYVTRGFWGTEDFRSFGISTNVGNIKALEWIGTGTYTETVLMPYEDGVWYQGIIRTSQDTNRDFILTVWEKADPTNQVTIQLDHQDGTGWFNSDWEFAAKSRFDNDVLVVDDYTELSFKETTYSYDTLNNLIGVEDALGNQTTIVYDALSRKIEMDDPDMGTWGYAYNPAGSLIEQTDAKGNTLCFTYDQLERPLTREIGSFPCPGTNVLASYTYDGATNGVGQLHTVSWGPGPQQNSDTFFYDTLGRMVRQERLINGRSFTMETLSFDSIHRPLQVQYPNGEIITMTYDREGENSLTAGSDALVSDVRYNPQGQLSYIDRVHSWNLDTQFTYLNASGNFRLAEIRNGTTTDNRPDFTYQYDAVGNIIAMETATNGNGIDTQQFGYDSLNRLVSATASGGVADYTLNYEYNAIGNITSRDGSDGTFAYGYSGKPHAMARINGYPHFEYDANGNMISRVDVDGEQGYIQTFDEENRLVQVTSGAAAMSASFPFAYSAPNGDPAINNGLTSGFMDASREHSYTFTFAPGTGVTNFTLRMLDYGDFNPVLATSHAVSMVAYGSNGSVLDTHAFNHETLAENNPRSGTWDDPNPGTSTGDLYYTGDAVAAAPGEPGNYTFSVSGINITRVELSFTNDVTGIGSSDPNVGFTDLCFTGRGTGGEVCPDFSQVEAGSSIEGLGAVHPNLNISTGAGGGETTRFAYDASGQRTLTIEPDGTEIYYPFAGYEEEIQPGSAQAGLPPVMAVAQTSPQPAAVQASPAAAPDVASTVLSGVILIAAALIAVHLILGLIGVRRPQLAVAPLRQRTRQQIWQLLLILIVTGLLLGSFAPLLVVRASETAKPAAAPVAPPWTSADIGSVGVAGSADVTNGTYTVEGAGADIGGTVDAFHFTYQTLSGDGEIIANMASLAGGGSVPKAGVMIRESLTTNSTHISALVRGNRVRVLERATPGSATTEPGGHTQGAPEWLRIVRTGNTFDVYNSNNGSSWALMASRTVSMGTNVYIGLAVTGNSTSTLATGTFNNVSVSGGSGPTVTPSPTVTLEPTATPTSTPTPLPSPTPPPPAAEVVVQRTTYTIAGQAVFLRIRTLEDSVETDNRLYAMHTDHLGSTRTLSYLDPAAGTAYQVQDARAYYEPFGDYRLEPTGEYTDRGYTGHLGNNSGSNDIDLIYMNARFYVPGVGRFASADTIVPDPTNPQSYNRYSYVLNSPLNFTDPSGHRPAACSFEGECGVPIGLIDFDGVKTNGQIAADLFNWYVADPIMALVEVGQAAFSGQMKEDFQSNPIKAGMQYGPPVLGLTAGMMGIKGPPGMGVVDDSIAAAKYGDELVETFADCLTNSFAAGTIVMTDQGPVPIQEIEVGTMVLAYNEETGETGNYSVTHLISHIDMGVIYLTISGEVIVTTANHPFHTSSGEWVDAINLEPGTEIRTANWDTGLVEEIYIVTQPQQMYNFTVITAHSYFVGDGNWLVHNSGPCDWVSPGGLIYTPTGAEGNRVLHVFEHLAPNPGKPNHTVFNVDNSTDLLPLIDEAWLGNKIQDPADATAWVTEMGRVVGTNGETKIRIIIRPGTTNEIITAYPVP